MTQKREQINRSWRFSTGGLYSRGVVRTRGYIPAAPPEETQEAPVRTRGAVRTRGPAVKVEPWQELKREELSGLLEDLREAQEWYPLTIVVENPQTPEAQAFLEYLRDKNLLEADDVLWVLGEDEYSEALQEFVPKDAYLNVQKGGQRTLVDTLVPDLVFVSDEDAEKLKERLKEWERRVWAVILAGPDDFDPSTLDIKLGIEGRAEWRRRWPRG